MTRPAPIIAGTLAALVLLFGAYMGAYYLAVQDDNTFWEPYYFSQSDPEPADYFFWLAHQVDRLIRPEYWGNE